MPFLFAGLAVLGLIIGSFLTVVIRRTGTGATIIRGRSRCPACGKTLRWFELLPALSYFIQGGQCRSCHCPISRFYPAVELITAALFAGLGWALVRDMLPPPPFAPPGAFGPLPWEDTALWFFYYAFFAASGIAISFYDLRRRMIPLAFVQPLLLMGGGAHVVGYFRGGSLLPAITAAAGAYLLFWSLWFYSGGRAMGRGDADVALVIVAVLGPAVGLLGILFGFWLGAILGILLVLAHHLRWSSRIPFTPFLFSGALAALFLGTRLAALSPFVYVF